MEESLDARALQQAVNVHPRAAGLRSARVIKLLEASNVRLASVASDPMVSKTPSYAMQPLGTNS
jgi:hypothetical protein